jgi:hypothetical protein
LPSGRTPGADLLDAELLGHVPRRAFRFLLSASGVVNVVQLDHDLTAACSRCRIELVGHCCPIRRWLTCHNLAVVFDDLAG